MTDQKKERKLTARQEKFCQEYVICGNAAKAARRAGYAENSARTTATQILAYHHIQQKIAEIRNRNAAKQGITLESIIIMLLDSYADAKRDGQHGPAVRAAELLGKHLGAFTDRIKVASEDITDTEVVKRLAGDDETKAALIRQILGAGDTFEA